MRIVVSILISITVNALALEVVIDPYEDIDYEEINSYTYPITYSSDDYEGECECW
jgi:hypothetical protein